MTPVPPIIEAGGVSVVYVNNAIAAAIDDIFTPSGSVYPTAADGEDGDIFLYTGQGEMEAINASLTDITDGVQTYTDLELILPKIGGSGTFTITVDGSESDPIDVNGPATGTIEAGVAGMDTVPTVTGTFVGVFEIRYTLRFAIVDATYSIDDSLSTYAIIPVQTPVLYAKIGGSWNSMVENTDPALVAAVEELQGRITVVKAYFDHANYGADATGYTLTDVNGDPLLLPDRLVFVAGSVIVDEPLVGPLSDISFGLDTLGASVLLDAGPIAGLSIAGGSIALQGIYNTVSDNPVATFGETQVTMFNQDVITDGRLVVVLVGVQVEAPVPVNITSASSPASETVRFEGTGLDQIGRIELTHSGGSVNWYNEPEWGPGLNDPALVINEWSEGVIEIVHGFVAGFTAQSAQTFDLSNNPTGTLNGTFDFPNFLINP